MHYCSESWDQHQWSPIWFASRLGEFLYPPPELLQDMLRKGVISPSKSLWASPIVLVKKDGCTWFHLDYHKVNEITRYPIPQVDDTSDTGIDRRTKLRKLHFDRKACLNLIWPLQYPSYLPVTDEFGACWITMDELFRVHRWYNNCWQYFWWTPFKFTTSLWAPQASRAKGVAI